MIKAGLVVVWYNPTDEEKGNINTYIKYVDKIYIIDNSEKENEYKKNKKIQYQFNNENLGIAAALNMAVEYAIKDGYEWLITMDQDTNFQNDDISKILNYISQNNMDKVGIVSPWHNTKLHVAKPTESIDYPLDVMTSGNFLNLKVLKKVGGFKEELFIDGVDIEYCLRLHKKGYKVVRLNDYEIIHNLGNICYKKVFKKELVCLNHNYIRDYYKIRNYRYIKQEYKKDFPEFCNILIKVKSMIWCIIFYEKDKFRKLRSILYGYIDYKRGITGKYNH